MQRHRWPVLIGTSLAFLLLAGTTAGAAGPPAVSQGFNTAAGSLSAGTLVMFTDDAHSAVQAARGDQADQLVGVVADKPLVALDDGNAEAQVVVSGRTPALVSDINGDIKAGDKITASPIEGVGMRAGSAAEIVGTAESNLKDARTADQTVTDAKGRKTTVKLGLVDVQVNVSYYAPPGSKLDAVVPSFLVSVASSIAGKNLSPLRVLMGFSGLLLGFVIAGIMVQAGVRSGIISLGRNPLAHKFLRRGLNDVLVTSVAVLVITVMTFYLILTV